MGAPIQSLVAVSSVPAPDPHQAVFAAVVLPRLQAEVGVEVFDSWFRGLQLDRFVDGRAHLSVATKFLRSWIWDRYREQLSAAVIAGFASATLSLEVRSTARAQALRMPAPAIRSNDIEAPAIATARAAAPTVAAALVNRPAPAEELSSPLDRRMTFETFHAGRSNQLAHAAASSLANGSSVPFTGPLVVHGLVGLGKTHLLHATVQAARASGRRAVYLTAERFMYGFAIALRSQTTLAFKEQLRGIDLLAIDDGQFLQGKSVQAEFARTVDAFVDTGKQLIVAADRPPVDLEALDDRVRSRLSAGLVCEVGRLDEPLRARMIEAHVAIARVSLPGFDVPPAVIAYVASVIHTNGRDIEGAVNRLIACVSLTGAALTVETAASAIADLVREREPKRVRIEDIQKLVATHYNVSRADILSSRRTANVVRPRQIAMYLSKVLTLRSLPEIGRRFGGRDHTTVLHAVRKIESLTGNDRVLADEVGLFKKMLQD